MSKLAFKILIGCLCLLVSIASWAENVTYSISYSPQSKYQSLSLKNVSLNIRLYANGSPRGRLNIKTNDDQSFVINNTYGKFLTVEILSITGEEKNISCHGVAGKGETKIQINCHSRYGKEHLLTR